MVELYRPEDKDRSWPDLNNITSNPSTLESLEGSIAIMPHILQDPLLTQLLYLENAASPQTSTTQAAPLRKRTGFFSLPWDLRVVVYNHVLHPRCRVWSRYLCEEPALHDHPVSFDGSIHPLLLCKQSYREVIEILHTNDIVIDFTTPASELWLDSKTMTSAKSSPARGIVFLPRFSELQFMSFRRVELVIDFGYSNWCQDDRAFAHWALYTRIRSKVKALAATLKKSQHIQSVKITLGTNETLDQAITNTGGPRTNGAAYLLADEAEATMISLFLPVLEVCRSKQFAIYFNSSTTDPTLGQYLTITRLNDWLRSSGAQLDPRIDEVLNISCPAWHEDGTWDWSSGDLPEWHQGEAWEMFSARDSWLRPRAQASIDVAKEPKLVYANPAPYARVQTPECLRCMRVFGSREQLREHRPVVCEIS